MPIKVTFAGETWLTEDLTLDEFGKIEDDLGATWVRFNPLLSSKHAKAALVAFLTRSIGEEAASKKIGALSLKEAVACFEVVPDDLPDMYEDGVPKAEGATETGGSSPAPPDSDGPLT